MMKTININNKSPVPFNDSRSPTRDSIIRKADAYLNEEDVTFYGTSPSKEIYHNGYLDYLGRAWKNHYSVVIRPDDIWYMILNELSLIIAKTPDDFSKLFTKTPDKKQLVVVQTNNIETIDPKAVIACLHKKVPTDINTFIPVFSTSTEMSKLAMNVTFCDALSPYYNYGTFLCGIPNVRIEGTDEDWNIVKNNLFNISVLFQGKVKRYFEGCIREINNFVKACESSDKDYFEKMVKLTKCGSGHQYKMSGWILNFLSETVQNTQLEGLPSHFSHMDYTNLDTDRKFSLYCGLFHSQIQDEFLVPEYGAFRFEITGDLPEQRKLREEEARKNRKLSVISTPVVGKPTTIRKWTTEASQDLVAFHSLDLLDSDLDNFKK